MEVTITTPTVFQIKALRRNFRNYAAVDIFRTLGFMEPMVKDTKDWEGSLEPYYQRAADHLAQQGITGDMARQANGFWKKYKGRGTVATALAKLGYEGAAVPFGKTKAKATTKAAPAAPAAAPAAPAVMDPKVMLTQAFIAGQITAEDFAQAVAALGTAKIVEVPPTDIPELDLTGTDEDLPF